MSSVLAIPILLINGVCCNVLGQKHRQYTIKNLPTVLEIWVRSLGWEHPQEKGKASHSSILAWRIPWTIVHGGAKSWTWLSDFHFHFHAIYILHFNILGCISCLFYFSFIYSLKETVHYSTSSCKNYLEATNSCSCHWSSHLWFYKVLLVMFHWFHTSRVN